MPPAGLCLKNQPLSTRTHKEKCRHRLRPASGAPVFANGAVTAAMGFAFNQVATSQDEIRIGLSEQNPDGGFSSSEEAILAQHRANEGAFQATASDEELVGFIGVRTIDDVDRFFFSDMIKVDATFDFSFIPVGPRDLRIFMISHTHPAATGTSQEGFSRRDSRLVGSKRNPGFRMNVRTPSGDVRILTPDTSRGVRMQPGRSICGGSSCLPPHKFN